MATEPERAGHQLLGLAARLECFDVAPVRLPVSPAQFGFGIEQVDLTGAANLHQHDDRLGSGGEVTRPGPEVRPTGGRACAAASFFSEQMGKREGTESEGRLLQKRAAADRVP